jgi:hypothetical protein
MDFIVRFIRPFDTLESDIFNAREVSQPHKLKVLKNIAKQWRKLLLIKIIGILQYIICTTH